MYKKDLALNNVRGFLGNKTNQPTSLFYDYNTVFLSLSLLTTIYPF